MGATIIITEYLAERGRAPQGEGVWLFFLIYDDGSSDLHTLTGEFEECSKRVIDMADDGLKEIVLLP